MTVAEVGLQGCGGWDGEVQEQALRSLRKAITGGARKKHTLGIFWALMSMVHIGRSVKLELNYSNLTFATQSSDA
jgi:hypothetical protein